MARQLMTKQTGRCEPLQRLLLLLLKVKEQRGPEPERNLYKTSEQEVFERLRGVAAAAATWRESRLERVCGGSRLCVRLCYPLRGTRVVTCILWRPPHGEPPIFFQPHTERESAVPRGNNGEIMTDVRARDMTTT